VQWALAAVPGWTSRSPEGEGPYTLNLEDIDVPGATVGECPDAFARPALSTVYTLDELGLLVTGQRPEPHRAVLACRVLEPD